MIFTIFALTDVIVGMIIFQILNLSLSQDFFLCFLHFILANPIAYLQNRFSLLDVPCAIAL